jgi:hypothetical protein
MWQWLTILLFAIANIFLAKVDFKIIALHYFIKHGINGLVYSFMLLVPYLVFKNYWLLAALLFTRLLVFNIGLSRFRKLKWDYVSPERKSIVDRIAFFFFRYNGKLMYAVYALAFVITTIKM